MLVARDGALVVGNWRGVWRAVPQYHNIFVAAYREDLFKKASLKGPDTWEDLYVVGKELKKMGNPVGIPISQNYDSISTAGPVLWSFGGMEVDKDGKTIRINAPATEQMIEWYKKMYRDCMEPEVLSWSDASNNESIQQGKAGWIHNPVSAYIIAKKRKLVTADRLSRIVATTSSTGGGAYGACAPASVRRAFSTIDSDGMPPMSKICDQR